MTPQQFFLVLRARWLVLLLTFSVVVGVTAALSMLSAKQYTATASVVLDVKSPDPVSGMMLAGLMAPGYMATQVDIIKSDRTARRVVRNLKLDSSATARAQWTEATGGRGDLVDWLSELLSRNLDVKPSRESNVINIEYLGTDPGFAAAVANAFAQAYIDVNVELRTEPARLYAGFFDEQTRTARERLERAQKALSDYQQQQGITSTDERLDFETAKLNETSSQLTAIQAATTDSQSKRQRSDTESLAEVMQSPLINGLKADIARQEAKLTEAGLNLGANHPQYLRMQSELQALREQLEGETRKITSAINTTYEVNRQREAQLRSALMSQKERVLELNQQRDQILVLRREIELAQRLFDTVSSRASQSTLESQASQTNISVLNAAVAPNDPTGPRVKLNVAIAAFLGGLLGVMLALGLEFLQRRVRSGDDLMQLGELPLLGQVSSARGMIRPSRLSLSRGAA